MPTPNPGPIPAELASVPELECGWFHGCDAPSVAVVEHPTVGDVEICAHHLAWLTEDVSADGSPNPTKMVPPMAARHFARLGAIFAELEEGDDQ